MSRSIPAAIVTALGQEEISPFYAVELNFDGGTIRLWTGFGDRVIDGQTYIGTVSLLSVAGIEEAAD